MQRKHLLLKISFVMLLLLAGLHTFFILIGGPSFPNTPEFNQMRKLMAEVRFDTGGNTVRSMQNIMDGFNIIVSIFLITLPLLSWAMLGEIRDNKRAVKKLALVNLLAAIAFFLTSLTLLAIGGTVVSGLVCLLLITSLLLKK
jgi:hypothetical protein